MSEVIAVSLIAGIVSGLFSGAGTALLVEAYKASLARKARYYECQYDLYNKLWNSLYDLQKSADKLWLFANKETLRSFNDQLTKTWEMVQRNTLLIEEKHYEELIELFYTFGEFKFGKIRLIELKESPQEYDNVNNTNIKSEILHNEKTKKRYEKLLWEISKSFRNQIKSP